MKPIGRKNYGSIPHLRGSNNQDGDSYITEGQERILTEKRRDKHDRIIVTEKYDGSNVGIAKKDGKIYALTRSGYEAKTSPYKQHHLFDKWVRERSDFFNEKLNEGERLTGEWLAQVHGTFYTITGNPIVFFDLFNAENERCIYSSLIDRLWGTPLCWARLLSESGAIPIDVAFSQCATPYHAHPVKTFNVEGIVYRCERKSKVDFLAKWVNPDFVPGKYIIGVDEEHHKWNI